MAQGASGRREGRHGLARQRPSFLKRQKEQKRNAKAAAKRARRESKRQEGGAGLDGMMARVNEFGDIVEIDAPESETGEEEDQDEDEDAPN